MKNQFHPPTASTRLTNALTTLLARSAGLWTALGRAARLLPLLLLLTLPAVVQAQFNYTTDNGTITITGYTGPGGAVTIPSTINGLPVTTIGQVAFNNQSSVTSVTIPSNVTSIIDGDRRRGGAFSGCTGLTNVTIGNSVTNIGYFAFAGCSSLISVTIPNSVISIGAGAFYDCTSLTSVTIGNSLTSIGFEAFYYCTSLRAITVDALNSAYGSVDGVLFNKSQTTLIQYPEGKAGSYTIPNSVTNLGDAAFIYCFGLTNVTIGDSVTILGNSAFYGCTSLTSVTIGNSVTSIETVAFYDCTSLTSITLPNSVTNIGNYAFADCTSLSAITVEALNSFYSSVDGVLFEKSQTTLIQYPGGKAGSDYTIPNTVISIGNRAFSYCSSLIKVTIPNSVTSIGNAAFYRCTSLTSATIGNSVAGIANYAFYQCYSLTSVTIPNSVTSIGEFAFYEGTSLTGVYFKGNAPSAGLDVFNGANKTTVYYLPGTTGWGATFAGRPTAQWLPEARASDADFGVRTNQFGFNIRWASDKVVVVEASPDLSNPVWTPVSTNTLTGGSSYFSDPQWTNHPTRFYRLVSPIP